MYTEKEFIEAVKNSKSVAEVHQKLNLSQSGTSYKTVKNKIKNLNIDISHFCKLPKIKGGKNLKKHWTKILIKKESGRINCKKLKRALLESGVEYKCSKCGLKNKWQNEEITLEIDHINENILDNRKENLQFLCPNCHSQKPILKNIKKTNNCEDCSKKIYKNSKKCRSCAARKSSLKLRKIKQRPSLEQLEKEIDELGYSATARKYNVTDNTIRNWIKYYKNGIVAEIV